MSKNRNHRPRGGDSTEESLRGKNRELQKIIKAQSHRIRQLEKKLGLGVSDVEEPVEEKRKAPDKIMCNRCSRGEMKEFILEKPGGLLIFLTCEICKHREKKIK